MDGLRVCKLTANPFKYICCIGVMFYYLIYLTYKPKARQFYCKTGNNSVL